ncbi:MAG: hypothetical protein OXK72_08120 [Gammaproteobacteria bacterium]|nr:hypothetical protein [Gammaproteobacteria bacterium]MDE0410836.1 hypothetical protein [Gammaproteobacteria bacterium]
MTFTNLALVAIAVLISISPLLFAGWIEWLENRPGGAHEYHVRRIKELCNELGEKPKCDPVTLSWRKAEWECIRLGDRVKRKRYLEDVYSRYGK